MTKEQLITSIVESTKEGLRVVLLAVIPVVILGINHETGMININWQLVQAVGVLALLRFVDKWLHESDVAKKGLTRF